MLLLLGATPLSADVETAGGMTNLMIERNTTIPTNRDQLVEDGGRHDFRDPQGPGSVAPCARDWILLETNSITNRECTSALQLIEDSIFLDATIVPVVQLHGF